MDHGFLPLSRQIFEHEFWTEKRVFSHFEAFTDLIQRAAWSDDVVVVRGKSIPLKRGELVGSLRFLGTHWKWSPMKVARFFLRLESETVTRQQTRQGETVITIVEYNTYITTKTKGETGDNRKTRQNKRKELSSPDGDEGNAGDPRFKPVTDGYCDAFKSEFGEAYVHGAGRDGKALKALLASLKPEEFTAERIVKTAVAALAHSKRTYAKDCKHARTIRGFCGAYNEIRAELNAEKSDGKPHLKPAGRSDARSGSIDRNAGGANAGTTSDYSGVGRVAARADQVPDPQRSATGGAAD